MKNKIVVITGSTRGFGYAIAKAMLKAGATMIISGRSKQALDLAIKSLESLGPLTGLICDLREEKQVYALARQTVEKYGRIDIWINNAGYSASAGMILDTPPDQAMDMFITNDLGTLYGTQAALHFMLARKQGTLVNIYGNGSTLRPVSPTGLYGATKAWITSFTRSLSKELKGSGVKIVAFSPGMILTDMLSAPTVVGERGRETMKNYAFVLRFLAGSPQKAAEKLVATLESNQNEFIEYRMLKPWSFFFSLLRVTWENLTKTGKKPVFEVHYQEAYQSKYLPKGKYG
jgi:short-subunit dehydrogenase